MNLQSSQIGFLVLMILSLACAQTTFVDSFHPEREVLQEYTFELRYPKDWKITSEVDNFDR